MLGFDVDRLVKQVSGEIIREFIRVQNQLDRMTELLEKLVEQKDSGS